MENKKYQLISIDPPWTYRNASKKVQGAAKEQYECMTMEELKNLPIGDLADKNCALLLWCVHPKAVEGAHCKLFDAWGFRPVSCLFNWVKTTKAGNPYMGVGYYSRGDSEPCYLGIKGKMTPINRDVRQTITTPRTRHSAKPNDEVRRRVKRLWGDLPNKIEIFARPPIPKDWDAIGYDIDGMDIRKSLAIMLGEHKMFYWDKQIKDGNKAESIFENIYKNKIKRLAPPGPDFQVIKTGDFIELKGEMKYPPINIFVERYGNKHKKTLGGPWKAVKDKCKYYIHFFVQYGVLLIFSPEKLIKEIDVLEQKGLIKIQDIKNEQWTTQGYKVPIKLIKHICKRIKAKC